MQHSGNRRVAAALRAVRAVRLASQRVSESVRIGVGGRVRALLWFHSLGAAAARGRKDDGNGICEKSLRIDECAPMFCACVDVCSLQHV